MLDIVDPMNVGKTFVERNERRKFQRFFITSYFLNTQTTVSSIFTKMNKIAHISVCDIQTIDIVQNINGTQ